MAEQLDAVARPGRVTARARRGAVTATARSGQLSARARRGAVTAKAVHGENGLFPYIVFTSSDASIEQGQNVTITWTTTGDVAWIDQGIGKVDPSGSLVARLTSTTTFTITAANRRGTSTAIVTVVVWDAVVTISTELTDQNAYVNQFGSPVAAGNYLLRFTATGRCIASSNKVYALRTGAWLAGQILRIEATAASTQNGHIQGAGGDGGFGNTYDDKTNDNEGGGGGGGAGGVVGQGKPSIDPSPAPATQGANGTATAGGAGGTGTIDVVTANVRATNGQAGGSGLLLEGAGSIQLAGPLSVGPGGGGGGGGASLYNFAHLLRNGGAGAARNAIGTGGGWGGLAGNPLPGRGGLVLPSIATSTHGSQATPKAFTLVDGSPVITGPGGQVLVWGSKTLDGATRWSISGSGSPSLVEQQLPQGRPHVLRIFPDRTHHMVSFSGTGQTNTIYTPASALDFSGQVRLKFWLKWGHASAGISATDGVRLHIGSGGAPNSNFREWRFGTNDGITFLPSPDPYVIHNQLTATLSAGTQPDTGTPDLSNVTQISFVHNVVSPVTNRAMVIALVTVESYPT